MRAFVSQKWALALASAGLVLLWGSAARAQGSMGGPMGGPMMGQMGEESMRPTMEVHLLGERSLAHTLGMYRMYGSRFGFNPDESEEMEKLTLEYETQRVRHASAVEVATLELIDLLGAPAIDTAAAQTKVETIAQERAAVAMAYVNFLAGVKDLLGPEKFIRFFSMTHSQLLGPHRGLVGRGYGPPGAGGMMGESGTMMEGGEQEELGQ